jgi:hypothetical protein
MFGRGRGRGRGRGGYGGGGGVRYGGGGVRYGGGGVRKGKGLTPYQGEKRCYGYFECTACDKLWESGNSWADTYQECKRCGGGVYPYKQKPLDKKDGEEKVDLNKPHLEELCGKCKQLGYCCKLY